MEGGIEEGKISCDAGISLYDFMFNGWKQAI
jgi:hypothetical protein